METGPEKRLDQAGCTGSLGCGGKAVDIAYPHDINLLNQTWEKAEKTMGELCKMKGQKKPPDVSPVRPPGFPSSVQKQETQYKGGPFNGTQTAAIQPPGHRLHS